MLSTFVIFGLIWSVGVLMGALGAELYYAHLREELHAARTRLRWKDR